MKPPGFTLIELLVTLATLATLGVLVVPLAEVQFQRAREQELRIALREIRSAIDSYKRATDEGRVRKDAGSTGYPKQLDDLVRGVEDQRDPNRRKIYFLRRIPRDPMSSDSAVADAETWGLRAYSSEPDDPQPGDDIYDVWSQSARIGLNGAPYRKW